MNFHTFKNVPKTLQPLIYAFLFNVLMSNFLLFELICFITVIKLSRQFCTNICVIIINFTSTRQFAI